MRILIIRDCKSIATLTGSLQHLTALSELTFRDCPELEMVAFLSLPTNLTIFLLDGCPEVKSLPNDIHRLASLKSLFIEGCKGIATIPSLPTNLSRFHLINCPEVKSLPDGMHHLTSLKELHIYGCHGITRLPRGGLPPNVETLWIWGCRDLNQPIEEWGLRGLAALRPLSIWGGMECVDEMECFPPSSNWSALLPPSLLRLYFGGMKKMERIGGGLRHHLTSLQTMDIDDCERLRFLPEDGFPDSLEGLTIRGCPEELEEKCRKGKGEYWPHLRLIPKVTIRIY